MIQCHLEVQGFQMHQWHPANPLVHLIQLNQYFQDFPAVQLLRFDQVILEHQMALCLLAVLQILVVQYCLLYLVDRNYR